MDSRSEEEVAGWVVECWWEMEDRWKKKKRKKRKRRRRRRRKQRLVEVEQWKRERKKEKQEGGLCSNAAIPLI